MVNDYQQSAFIVIKHNNTCNGEIIFYLFTYDDKISDILNQMVYRYLCVMYKFEMYRARVLIFVFENL